jgi:hypothetical protein
LPKLLSCVRQCYSRYRSAKSAAAANPSVIVKSIRFDFPGLLEIFYIVLQFGTGLLFLCGVKPNKK